MVLWVLAVWFGGLFAVTFAYLFFTPFIFEFFNAFEDAGYNTEPWITNMFLWMWRFFLVVCLLLLTMWAYSAAQRKEYFHEGFKL